jgi:hypothetical protein
LRIAPPDVPPDADDMEVIVGVLDEAFCIDRQPFGFQQRPLPGGEFRVHAAADPGVGGDDAVPGERGGFFLR